MVNHRYKNSLHTAVLFVGMMALLGVLGLSLGGARGLLWAAFLAVPFFVFGRSLSPRLVLRLYGARPLSVADAPELHRLVRNVARRAEIPVVPQLYYVPSKMMNALSVGHRNDPAIGITEGLLRGLSARELTGVIAHEMVHIQRNDTRVMAFADLISRLTGLLSSAGQFLLFLNLPLMLMGAAPFSWVTVLLMILAPMLSAALQMALSRSREFDADLGAAHLTGDPMGLASALRKIECQQAHWLSRLLGPGQRAQRRLPSSTHPQTDERVARLYELAGLDADTSASAREALLPCPEVSLSGTQPARWQTKGPWY